MIYRRDRDPQSLSLDHRIYSRLNSSVKKHHKKLSTSCQVHHKLTPEPVSIKNENSDC